MLVKYYELMIIGNEDYGDKNIEYEYIDEMIAKHRQLSPNDNIYIGSLGRNGAEYIAEQYAKEHDYIADVYDRCLIQGYKPGDPYYTDMFRALETHLRLGSSIVSGFDILIFWDYKDEDVKALIQIIKDFEKEYHLKVPYKIIDIRYRTKVELIGDE